MAKHRIALIGLGMAVTPHAKSMVDLKDRVEVVHAFSPSGARRKAFGEEVSVSARADSLDAILADKTVDCVEILTPPNTHLDLVQKCAAAGKHILLEKPLEITTARAVELVEAREGRRDARRDAAASLPPGRHEAARGCSPAESSARSSTARP